MTESQGVNESPYYCVTKTWHPDWPDDPAEDLYTIEDGTPIPPEGR